MCMKIKDHIELLTVNGPSTSVHIEGSALSPLPLKADCTQTDQLQKSNKMDKLR